MWLNTANQAGVTILTHKKSFIFYTEFILTGEIKRLENKASKFIVYVCMCIQMCMNVHVYISFYEG